ncbi:MAG TPA: peptidoglycan DD-metalloendopeptidase family protein, partial [Pararhizobium sp.]|nr:peptidoglycan DD-metalloendopeptidase family protein [Pararhizobium sp.]
VFGRRKRPVKHTIIIASGEKIRHFTLRPWIAGLAIGCVCLFAVGYLGATAYLFLRDDLIGTMERQAQMERSYEERIAALRAQVDRVTSRQLVNQQQIEQRVQKLYERQRQLSSQRDQLSSLMQRARTAGLMAEVPTPQARPDAAAGSPALDAIEAATGSKQKIKASLGALPVNAYLEDAALHLPRAGSNGSGAAASTEKRADETVGRIDLSLRKMEHDQFQEVRTLTSRAIKTAAAITTVLHDSGLPASIGKVASGGAATTQTDDGIGGPYIRLSDPAVFDKSLARLNKALDRLESVRKKARKLPFGRPLADDIVTSNFGARDDPFFERMAFHPGVDLRAARGTDVHATGAGKVIFAGRLHGYGNMVEIDHGDGVTTRYGHLSKILVHKGEHVACGAIVGESGSTGRSTGPHLHYEVRLNDHPVDPERFLSSGLALRALMGS